MRKTGISTRTSRLWMASLLGLSLGSGLAQAQTPPPSPPTAMTAHKPAYYVAEFHLTDPEGIKPYSEKVESTFKPFSGRYVVRGGDLDVKEGLAAQGRLVVIQFDSVELARAWYESPAYQAIIPIRHRSGTTRTYIVEGLEEH